MTAAVCALLKVLAGLSAVAFAEAEAKAEGVRGKPLSSERGSPARPFSASYYYKFLPEGCGKPAFSKKRVSRKGCFPSPQKLFLSLLFCQ